MPDITNISKVYRHTDIKMRLRLSDAGVIIDLASADVLAVNAINVEQETCTRLRWERDSADTTRLVAYFDAGQQCFLGLYNVELTIKYDGRTASVPIPAFVITDDPTDVSESEDVEIIVIELDGQMLNASTSVLEGLIKRMESAVDQAVNPPIIQDGYWFMWSTESKSYVDTGVPATGPQGPQGEAGATYDDTQVRELIAGKANLQHQHTVADITDFPELYYDATAFLTSETYPSDRYEELLEAVKAKKTVYATIDEEGYVSYVFFMSSANSYGTSSRVLLTTIFADGGNLYINTFVLQQSGMTPLQESITGKADKAKTLAGYGIGDAYTKGEVDDALEGKQEKLVAGDNITIVGNVISSTGGGGGGSIDLSAYAKKVEVEAALEGKQDTIADLEAIREGAELGKTSLQEHQDISKLATKEEVATKQDKISDLATIRSGAAKGATALQSYTETDPVYMADKPSLALKSEIPDISGKADKTTTLAGYGIADAYTKNEVDAAISAAITTTLNTEV